MKLEIERKYLARLSEVPAAILAQGQRLLQAYLTPAGHVPEVRVRLARGQAVLGVKRPAGQATKRHEVEYAVDGEEAYATLTIGCPAVGKCRHPVLDMNELPIGVVEVVLDVYEGDNHGLAVVEVEYTDEAALARHAPLPGWVAADVTGMERYKAAVLARRPYKGWTVAEHRDHGRLLQAGPGHAAGCPSNPLLATVP